MRLAGGGGAGGAAQAADQNTLPAPRQASASPDTLAPFCPNPSYHDQFAEQQCGRRRAPWPRRHHQRPGFQKQLVEGAEEAKQLRGAWIYRLGAQKGSGSGGSRCGLAADHFHGNGNPT